MYNRIDRAGVAKAMANFDWDGFWKSQGLADVKDVTVGAPEFFTGVDALLTSTKPEIWRNYLRRSRCATTSRAARQEARG